MTGLMTCATQPLGLRWLGELLCWGGAEGLLEEGMGLEEPEGLSSQYSWSPPQ